MIYIKSSDFKSIYLDEDNLENYFKNNAYE